MGKDFSFDTACSFVGQWWLPGKEDCKIIGVLNFSSENGLRLNLESFFTGREFDVIFGEASGSAITLLNCFTTTYISPFHEFMPYAPTEVIANQAVIGLHANSEQNLEFDRIIFETTDFKSWSYLTGIDNREFLKCFDKGAKSFVLPYQMPEAEIFYVDDNIEISLRTSLKIPSLIPPPTEITFTEKNFFEINNKAAKKGLFFFGYIDAIRKFVSLAMRKNIEIKKVRAFPKGITEYVDVVYSPTDIDMDYTVANPSFSEMFFTYSSVKDRIQELCSNWLEGYDKITKVYNLYFFKAKGMMHNVFLSKAQALEEYHRTIYVPESRDFKVRVDFLFDKYAGIMNYTGQKDVFAELIKDHRDYYSHWFQKKEHKVFKGGINLDYLSRDANLLLEMCLLTQMGFDDAEVIHIVENCTSYHSYLNIGRQPERVKWEPGII